MENVQLKFPNVQLAQQLREILTNDVRVLNSCVSRARGELRFFVRNCLLQKTIYVGQSLLNNSDDEVNEIPLEVYDRMIKLVVNSVRKSTLPLEYCTLVLTWDFDPEEEEFTHIEFLPIFEEHYARK